MTEPRETELRDARKDNPARFLRELRALRHHAGLDHAELAARAHYPCEVIKAAEAGPSLPDLPVLSAFVRGRGGTLAEWEERWRAVTGSPASPLLPTRSAGCSEAANAGARVSATAGPDGHDPDRVMAALNRVADGMAAAASSSASAPGANGSGPGPGKAGFARRDAASSSASSASSASSGLAGASQASAAWDLDHADAVARDFTPSADGAAWDFALKAEQARYPAPATPAPAPKPAAGATSRPAGAAPGRRPSAGVPRAGTSKPRRSLPSRLAIASLVLAVLLLVAALTLFA